ncbi:hypothetical protein ACLKA7_000941 [Drosophila subpalustris]
MRSSYRKLPKLVLPTFAGNYADYKNLIALFNQLVSPENYRLALDRLRERYDNPTLVFLNNVSALFKLKNGSGSNCQEIRSLIDNATAFNKSLTSLGGEAQIAQALPIAIAMEMVDPETKREWNKSLDYSTLPIFGIARSELRVIRCNQFNDMTVTERYEAAKRLSLCLNCLGKGHLAAKCSSNQRCRTCSRLHHSLLGTRLEITGLAVHYWIPAHSHIRDGNSAVSRNKEYVLSVGSTHENQRHWSARYNIKSSFYVGDFLCGHNTAEGLRQLKAEVTEIQGKGKFLLAK